MSEHFEWGDLPYDSKTPAEVIDDYVLNRGDLSTEHARQQLAEWIERYAERPRKPKHEARKPSPLTMIGRTMVAAPEDTSEHW